MQPNKRNKIVDSSGWTHVVCGPPNTVNTNQVNEKLQNHDSISLEQLFERHARCMQSWESSDCWKTLADFIESIVIKNEHIRPTNCVCLGLGSLSAGRASSKHELAALVSILRQLGQTSCIKNVVFQDPAFNEVDKAFLSELGYSVVPTPLGFDSISNDTFCFAPHLENEIFAIALRDVKPALCIGNSDLVKDQPLNSTAKVSTDALEIFRRFAEVSNSMGMPEYDQDSWCQFTSIYWHREDTE